DPRRSLTSVERTGLPATGKLTCQYSPAPQAIIQNGLPAGDLTDGEAHAGVLVRNFCIPPTGSTALDNLADLPGPGSLSLPGTAHFFAMRWQARGGPERSSDRLRRLMVTRAAAHPTRSSPCPGRERPTDRPATGVRRG